MGSLENKPDLENIIKNNNETNYKNIDYSLFYY